MQISNIVGGLTGSGNATGKPESTGREFGQSQGTRNSDSTAPAQSGPVETRQAVSQSDSANKTNLRDQSATAPIDEAAMFNRAKARAVFVQQELRLQALVDKVANASDAPQVRSLEPAAAEATEEAEEAEAPQQYERPETSAEPAPEPTVSRRV